MRIGLISDTHGLLRPQALAFLHGSDHIVHAGDICDAGVLAQLRTIAPVLAVRGNNDVGPWANLLRATELADFGGVRLLAIHDLAQLGDAAREAGAGVVVSGHSHRPLVRREGGVLFVNPGSAGPRRFRLPVSVGELLVQDGQATARLVELEV